MNRRNFLTRAAVGGGLLLSPALHLRARPTNAPRLTILHTNDWHSRIDPFPDDGGRNANRGGIVRRAEMIGRVREAEPHVLLLDSGDIFQGTPYFNFFAGELEMKLMSKLRYDAATIGNHDFDGGMENLVTQMGHASFPMLSANYDFTGTPLEGKTKPYQIIKRGASRSASSASGSNWTASSRKVCTAKRTTRTPSSGGTPPPACCGKTRNATW